MSDAGKSREIAPGVVQVFLPLPFKPTIINVYLVRAGDTWTLVDTGMHTGDSKRAFAAVLAEHDIAPTAITRMVCTHHHIDHYGTSGPYRDLTHAQVFLHPLEAEILQPGLPRQYCGVVHQHIDPTELPVDRSE